MTSLRRRRSLEVGCFVLFSLPLRVAHLLRLLCTQVPIAMQVRLNFRICIAISLLCAVAVSHPNHNTEIQQEMRAPQFMAPTGLSNPLAAGTESFGLQAKPLINIAEPAIHDVHLEGTFGVVELDSAIENIGMGRSLLAVTLPSITSVKPTSGPATGGNSITLTGTAMGNRDISNCNVGGVDSPKIVSQAVSEIVFTAPAGQTFNSPLAVSCRSMTAGTFSKSAAYTYLKGTITSVSPLQGPASGGSLVTIVGTSLGSGNDVSAVKFGATRMTVVSQTTTKIVVQTAASFGSGVVTVISTSIGATTGPLFTFNPSPVISSVVPNSGSTAGNELVTISGTNLGSGSDVTAVSLAGVPAAAIVSQTATQIVVKTGVMTGSGHMGDVIVSSTGYGSATLLNSFGYITAVADWMTNYITFGGISYGVLDNADPTSIMTSCDTNLKALPPGWTLAADNADTRAAILGPTYQFGAQCVVLATGRSIGTVDSTADCQASGQLISSNGFYGATDCWARVLISKPNPTAAPTWNATPTISRIFPYQGYAMATIDNADAFDLNGGCTGTAFKIPSGWALADANVWQPVNAIQIAFFGANCVVFSNGIGYNHAGGQCFPNTQLLQVGDYYSVRLCSQRILLSTALPAPIVPLPVRTVNMKVLILAATATDSQIAVATRTMQSMSVPFDTFYTSSNQDLATFLTSNSDGDNVGNYQSIVVTSSGVVQGTPGLSIVLADYCRTYRSRVVYLYAYPTWYLGLVPKDAATIGSDTVNINIAPTFKTNAAVAGINPSVSVNQISCYHYPAMSTDSSLVTPVLEFFDANNVNLGLAAAEINLYDGRKELHFFYDQASWTLSGKVFAPIWLNWVTRGFYVGSRRVRLSAQVDDMLLSTVTWGTTTPTRMTPDDLQYHADFSTYISSQFPAGSTFRFEMAINGKGSENEIQLKGQDLLLEKSKQLLSSFDWETHTWSHLILTQNDANGTLHPTTYEEAAPEIYLNRDWALQNMFTDSNKLQYWSSTSAVTPGISGLMNPEALRAMVDNGLKYVVGDNSLPKYMNQVNPYLGLHTTTAFNGYEGIFIIPRYPTDVYFDTATPGELVAEYNHTYGAYWGRTLSLDEIMNNDAIRTVGNLMNLRHDPYMFHQANLKVFQWKDPVDGVTKDFSLISLWLRYVQMHLNVYSTLPVLSAEQDDLAHLFLEREQRENAGIQMKATVDSADKITSVTLSATAACKAGVTLLTNAASVFTNNANVQTEVYGPDRTAWVTFTGAGQVTLPLATPLPLIA